MRRFIAVCTLAAAALVTYETFAAAAPLKCSNDVNAGPIAVTSDVLTTDPVQKGHLHAPVAGPFTPSTCAAPTPAPAVVEATSDFHYKAHTFKNRSNAAACVEVRYVFTNPRLGTGIHETAAYLGSFDPADPAKNYLGDYGSSDGGPGVNAFSVNVPAMADFVLVASWTGPATPGYEPHYDLYVAGCGQMVVTGITPNAGPVEGGQSVTISGSGFENAAPGVTIGAPALNAVVIDDSTLTATTGANAAGVVDVTVTSGALVATLPASYTYGGAATTDAGADAGDAGADGGVDAGTDASTHGPTQGGPTQGSSSSGGTTSSDAGSKADAGDDDDDSDASTTADGGTKRVSAPTTKKKTSGGDEELVCACNEVGRSATPGFGAFATAALAAIAVIRIRRKRH